MGDFDRAARFASQADTEVVPRRLIEHQESFDLLHDWFHEALRAPSFEHFSRILWESPRANPA